MLQIKQLVTTKRISLPFFPVTGLFHWKDTRGAGGSRSTKSPPGGVKESHSFFLPSGDHTNGRNLEGQKRPRKHCCKRS